jgi:hypothetical protein
MYAVDIATAIEKSINPRTQLTGKALEIGILCLTREFEPHQLPAKDLYCSRQ